MNKIIYILSVSFLLLSCNQEKKEANVHNKGEITLQYDDAHTNVAQALSHRYEQNYPDTKIHHKISKEDQALEDLLNKKVDAIIMSRELTPKEREYWDLKTQMPWNPSYFAADAVVFVVNKNSPIEAISLEEITDMLNSSNNKLIFEGRNTSNFNAVIQKLNLDSKKVKFSKIEGNENIIKNLEKFPNNIGVISFNTISHPYGEKEKELMQNIKILPIKVDNTLVYPNKENLKSQKYPFTKLLYFITNETKFGLANGLIRYSCTNIGQKIVSKEGLQPFFIFPRTVKINTQN